MTTSTKETLERRGAIWIKVVVLLAAICGHSVRGTQAFDPAWYTQPKLLVPRSDLTATPVGDAIYLIGGCGAKQGYVSSDAMAGMGISDGWPGYYCGSFVEEGAIKNTTRFLPGTRTYEVLDDAPRPRYRHAAAAVGKLIYVFGGTDDTDVSIPEVDVFDTTTLTWSTLTEPMDFPYNDLSAFVYDDTVFAVGGYESSDYTAQTRIQALDTSTGSWTTVGNLQQGRGDAGAVVIGDTLYVAGGFHHSDWSAPLDSVEHINLKSFEPEDGTVAPLAVARGDKAMVLLHGLVHVIGGETKSVADGSSEPLTDVEVLEPVEGLWRIGGHIPWHRFRFVAAPFEDSVFLFGGQGYLVGEYDADGSYYPIVDTVTEYREVPRESDDGDDDSGSLLGVAVLALVFAVAAVILAAAALVKATSKSNKEHGMDACSPVRMAKGADIKTIV